MHGPTILARFLQTPSTKPDRYGRHWQYHSRSDRHSKVACWGVAFDLLQQSNLFRNHVASGKVVLGLNHRMTDYATSRQKDLDLVIARTSGVVDVKGATFNDLVDRYSIPLTAEETKILGGLPVLRPGPVGAVLVAVEAKACMTAHVKSLPRLYDELNSSHLCVHGASAQALAIGYAQINASSKFVSPVINSRWPEGADPEVSMHRQPQDTERVLGKLAEMPRRSSNTDVGFDGVGVTVLNFVNDGGPVELVSGRPSPPPGARFNYDDMIVRMANEYDWRFANT